MVSTSPSHRTYLVLLQIELWQVRLSGFPVCTRLEAANQKRRRILEAGMLATEKGQQIVGLVKGERNYKRQR